ncbi:MAG TPA: tRNA dihydrouridine(20/20a) synthase DusA [Methylococcaceae bacterium]|nr:tRNA dihydrouridine(20/20a) synthase DusA [Methylococcaceae bacterium]HIL39188.1 tRNA dihydrouridine(20/20a) synthase DusA [Methylococcales bacterium]
MRNQINRKVCVAPMLDWTDKHCRFFHRLISRHTVLYSEMITTNALLRGNAAAFLAFNPCESPLALQLGGSDPKALAECSVMAEDFGYDEINLNVGCPSDRVQNGRFGACLMAEPETVAECILEMQHKVNIPVTVKNRIGIDGKETYGDLLAFIETVAGGGCEIFIIHARIAVLSGLSPKQNRDIPPLQYEFVNQIKAAFPALEIIVNGGVKTLDQVDCHLKTLDGAMIGREAYHNPYLLSGVDSLFYQEEAVCLTRHEIIEAMIPYIQKQLAMGVRLNQITRHLLGLFHGEPGARKWRRYLSQHAHEQGANESVLLTALDFV